MDQNNSSLEIDTVSTVVLLYMNDIDYVSDLFVLYNYVFDDNTNQTIFFGILTMDNVLPT